MEEVRTPATQFIWGWRRSKIAYTTLTLPVSEGGLNLADVERRVQVNLLK